MNWFATDDYWIGRLVFQRMLALIYLLAFVGTAFQFRALIGSDGLTPIPAWLRRVPFRRSPSVFHLHYSDRVFALLTWLGAAISAALLVGAGDAIPLWASMLLWLVPWALYVSILNVGQVWYGFGWESLLCETGCYAIFLGSTHTAPPWLMLIALRWLLFRLEFGAGLIKIRGDSCWRDLTALYYHHETQPMPGPLSWFFHRLPRPVHRLEVAANHVTQLVVPFLLFAPAPVSTISAAVMIVTQLWLVCSGNFSWLNWLTITIAVSALPDSVWHGDLGLPVPAQSGSTSWFQGIVIAFAAVVLALSYWPARNLIARRQLMNFSFNRLHLVNAYGAFGSITRTRQEVVIEGTRDAGAGLSATWLEYEFRGKPGDPRRLPRQFAPYHLRLDWMMWFLALDPYRGQVWFIPFMRRLLCSDRATLKLIRLNPFPDSPPRQVRALIYRYRFTTWAERRETGQWWHRELIGQMVPPMHD
ncbi:lipase maturation factor family protein [Leekyejoonella antrihumi]|uniref:Lipase maturation factor family protein n=1 Tax=Leekyejoonella antrihumi TaxID=1660198 RepID=A0A563DWJ8_9MICO|nr:lipase maturation factor family protein [Leekyejoonella antrihumi]TWP34596.1 lipase maturation factor family protein [Leekyejoonella antrihumi]